MGLFHPFTFLEETDKIHLFLKKQSLKLIGNRNIILNMKELRIENNKKIRVKLIKN